MPYLYQLNDLIFSADKRVKKVTARLADSTSRIEYYNSWVFTVLIPALASLSVSHHGGKRQAGNSISPPFFQNGS